MARMSETEKTLLEELRKGLTNKVQRGLLDSYLKEPTSDTIVNELVSIVEKLSNEHATR